MSLHLVLITGMSGSGKSVALNALEDSGYYCIDNLPPELLLPFVGLAREQGRKSVAVAVDVRSAGSLPQIVPLIASLRAEGMTVRALFLDASNDALLRRFSETRRPHPLGAVPAGSDARRALVEAIDLERELLAGLRESATVIDTSQLRPAMLRSWVHQLVEARASALTLVFESFAYKQGVPLDADYVFDLRVLPNPHYVRELRPLSGRDAPVAAYLEQQPEVAEMLAQIHHFLARWLAAFEDDQRSYLTVALGCTGGQHRSVYAAEWLARRFEGQRATLLRHRELDARE